MLHKIEVSREQVENSPIRDLALKIRASMPSISKEIYLEYLARLEEKFGGGTAEDLGIYNPSRGCLVTNLSRLPADKLDFGTGPPDLVLPLTTGVNSVGILSSGADYVLRYAY